MSMQRSRRNFALSTFALIATAGLVVGCTGRGDDDGGEADPSESIVIGASWPLSGPLADVAPGLSGIEAYFDRVNADGGVDGRTIKLSVADDAYDPARLVENQRQFAEDGAVAVINFGGIAIAGRDYLAEAGIAGFTLAANSPFGEVDEYPLHRAWWPDLAWEGRAQAAWLAEEQPEATVGVMGLNNDLTHSLVDGLEAGGIEPRLVAEIPPGTGDVSAQITEFEAAGVDALVLAVGSPTISSALTYIDQIGWDPTISVTSTMSDFHTTVGPTGEEIVDGAYAFQFGKDPADPRYADDPALVEFFEAMDESGHSDDTDIALALNSYGMAAALVAAIETADEVTSEGIVAAWDDFSGEENPFLRDGLTLTNGPGGRVILEYQRTRFDGESWADEGDPVSVSDLGVE